MTTPATTVSSTSSCPPKQKSFVKEALLTKHSSKLAGQHVLGCPQGDPVPYTRKGRLLQREAIALWSEVAL